MCLISMVVKIGLVMRTREDDAQVMSAGLYQKTQVCYIIKFYDIVLHVLFYVGKIFRIMEVYTPHSNSCGYQCVRIFVTCRNISASLDSWQTTLLIWYVNGK